METTLSYIFKVNRPSGTCVKIHKHSCIELVLYLAANGTTTIGDIEYPVKPGDVAVIHAETPHGEKHKGCASVFCLAFHCKEFANVPEGVFKIRSFERLHMIFQQIYLENNGKDNYSKAITSALCKVAFVTVLRDVLSTTKSKPNIEQIANYLRENYFVQKGIQEIAVDFGCDYDYFRHEFKKLYKVSPKQYIMNLRLSTAYNMLYNSNSSCTDIAMQCGFSDSAQFSKLFRIKYGISPTECKKRCDSLPVGPKKRREKE